MIKSVQKIINKDEESPIKIVLIQKTSVTLLEKIIAAADTVSCIQVPGTVAKVDEVAPYIMNGVVLVGSGGYRQAPIQ